MSKIKELLEKSNISQSELSRRLGITRGSVSNWVKGKSNPTLDKYQQIIEILGETTEKSQLFSDVKFLKAINVPVLSYVQAGEVTEQTDLSLYDDIKYIPLAEKDVPKNGFLMEVLGDSMVYDFSHNQRLKRDYSRFHIGEGESVLVDPAKKDICNLLGKVVVAHNGTGTTVKLVYQDEKGLCLMPLNSRLQNNEEIKRPEEARIIGQVVRVVNERDFK